MNRTNSQFVTGRSRQFPAVEPNGPAADGVDRQYWEGLQRGEFLLQRCASCSTWIWGPQWICGMCHGFELEWVPVETEGIIYSWARTWHPSIPELAAELPYISVLVELPQAGGRRVLGLLAEDGGSVGIGDRVTGMIQQPPGADWPSLRWRPARNAATDTVGGKH